MGSGQPVAASRLGGAGKRLVNTTPSENDTLAATAARTPTASGSAPGRSTTSATPTTATQATATSSGRGRRPESSHVNAATSSGCTPPAAAATPPGKR